MTGTNMENGQMPTIPHEEMVMFPLQTQSPQVSGHLTEPRHLLDSRDIYQCDVIIVVVRMYFLGLV